MSVTKQLAKNEQQKQRLEHKIGSNQSNLKKNVLNVGMMFMRT